MDIPLRPGCRYSRIDVSGGYSHFGDVVHLPAQPETPPEPSSTILPRSDPDFIDRGELLEQIRAQASVQGAWIALVGLGGVGKTQIAIRYAQRLRAEDSSLWILWIFASNAARFDESIRDVTDQIRLPGRQDPKANILQMLQTWLADSRRRWTIVLDNADNMDFLLDPPDAVDAVRATKRRIDYFPTCDHGSVVITSRDKNEAFKFVPESNVVGVLHMDVKQATMLLQKKLRPLYSEKSGVKLAKALDFMPLVLSQAASFIQQKRRYTVEAYVAELEKSRQSRTSLLRKHGTVPRRDRDASSSIILALQISFERIYSARRSAADLLALMSFCDRQAIPEILIRSVYKRRDGGDAGVAEDNKDDEFGFDDDIQMLENFSFVSINPNSTTWDMHRLVQDATQWWLLDRGEVKAAQNDFVEHLHNVVPDGHYENWQTYKILMPHIKSALELNVSERDVSLLWADIMYKAARFTESQGSYKDAESMAERSCRVRASLLGAKHPFTLMSMANLASTYRGQGRWKESEELDVKVIEIRRRVLGAEHPDTLTSLSNLALTYYHQERLQESQSLMKQCVDLRTLVLGASHPDTCDSVASLKVIEDRARAMEGDDTEPMTTKLTINVLKWIQNALR